MSGMEHNTQQHQFLFTQEELVPNQIWFGLKTQRSKGKMMTAGVNELETLNRIRQIKLNIYMLQELSYIKKWNWFNMLHPSWCIGSTYYFSEYLV